MLLCVVGILRAQNSSAPAAAAQNAGALFNAGRYAEAAAGYEKFLKDYPTNEFAFQAQIELANAWYLTGKFDDAIGVLRKFLAAPASQSQPELLEAAAALLPEASSQKAATLKEAAARKATFDEATKEFGIFLEKYPRSQHADAALHGRALANFQLGKFVEAAADLRRSLREFAARETAPGSQFLLALTLAAQASKVADANDPNTGKLYGESETLFVDLIARKADVALANDAQFQLGDVLVARVATQPENAQAATLGRALEAFRAVEGKEPMIAAQTARVEAVKTALRAAAANRAEFGRLSAVLRRETTKLSQLQAREDDPALSARLRCAVVFYQLKKYDETRVLLGALAPLVTQPAHETIVGLYTALALAAQGASEPAAAAYERFQAKHAGDPLAEPLPLALGGMFLRSAQPDAAAQAGKYFDDFARLYPGSRLREVALVEAAELSARAGKFDAALKTLDDVLKTKPRTEIAAAAELIRARVLKDKGDLAGALAAFKKARDTFAGRPEAVEAAFWVGVVALQNRDAAGAAAELKAFLGRFANHPLAPAAQFALGRAQEAAGDKSGALATLRELSEKWPGSPEAVQSYFLRANLLYAEKKTAEAVRMLTEFTEKYPRDEKALDACDAIAAVLSANGTSGIEAAGAYYQKFLDVNGSSSPKAPVALLKIATLWKKLALAQGSYLVLGAAEREVWTNAVNRSVAASEAVIEKYPDSAAVTGALGNFVDCQRLLLGAKLKTETQVADSFAALAKREGTRGRVWFAAARLTAERDPAKGLSEMKAAYDPGARYSPADLDGFTQALLRTGDFAMAAAVFGKLSKDYPASGAAVASDEEAQEAQALALYGEGRLAEARGDFDAAARAYEKLKASHSRSNKLVEANVGIARRLLAAGKPDDALKLLGEAMRHAATPPEVRARALLLTAEVFKAKNDLPAAIDSFLKVAAFYPAAQPEAPSGLWEGAQLLEKQAANLSESTMPKRSDQLARARKAYADLGAKYAGAAFAAKARERLAILAEGR